MVDVVEVVVVEVVVEVVEVARGVAWGRESLEHPGSAMAPSSTATNAARTAVPRELTPRGYRVRR